MIFSIAILVFEEGNDPLLPGSQAQSICQYSTHRVDPKVQAKDFVSLCPCRCRTDEAATGMDGVDPCVPKRNPPWGLIIIPIKLGSIIPHIRQITRVFWLVVEPTRLKNMRTSNWIISSGIRDENKKYLSCHHLDHGSSLFAGVVRLLLRKNPFTSLKFNITSPLKNDAWKTIPSFW